METIAYGVESPTMADLWVGRVFMETITGKAESKLQLAGGAMKDKLIVSLLSLCLGTCAWAVAPKDNDKADNELQRATETIQHLTSAAPDQGVPNKVFEGAKCIAVIPKLAKGAFVVGAEHGKGVATCRAENGSWSSPAPFSVSGISWGPQIGGKSSDLIMFIMNDEGMNSLMKGHIKLGADVSAAAGPVGRTASADAGLKAGILTYSSSKGAFIGASLNGAELNQDHDATREWYGSDISFADMLKGQAHTSNPDAIAFVNAVQSAKETAQMR